MTVKQLMERLRFWPPEWEIEFNGLTFFRLKMRDEAMVNMEFNELFRVIELQPAKPGDPIPPNSYPRGSRPPRRKRARSR